MSPRRVLELGWRQMVRLPKEWGTEIEEIAMKRGLSVGATLRVLLRERLDQLKDNDQERRR